MEILAIYGSPRQTGNTSNSGRLLAEALAGIKYSGVGFNEELKIKRVNPVRRDISPCQACSACYQDGRCIIKDDMQQMCRSFDRADIILVAAPVYFNGISAQLKAMIDRCQAIWSSKYKADNPLIDRAKDRYGYLFATGGAPAYQGQFLAARQVMEMFFRVINTEFVGDLTVPDIDQRPVKTREKVLKKAYQIGVELMTNF